METSTFEIQQIHTFPSIRQLDASWNKNSVRQVEEIRRSSEAKRQALLNKSARIRTEAIQLEVESQLLDILDKTEGNIKLARVDVRKYRDFLRYEGNQLDTVQEKLHTIKATCQRTYREGLKASVLMLVLICIPNIFLSKLYCLSLIPKHIPASSAYMYLAAGDVLFYTWIIICILYCIAYRYVTIHYIIPFTEKYPSLKLLTKLCSASTFLCLHGQFLFYSASLTPRLISPLWGPSLVNIVKLLTTILTSNPITAVSALITILPPVSMLLRWYKKALSPMLPAWHKKRVMSTPPQTKFKKYAACKEWREQIHLSQLIE